MKRKLLWVGDAAVASGFARATHQILDRLRQDWDVAVLGLNYQGDPHEFPYPIFPCWPGGDAFGVNRIKPVIESFRPDVVLLQNDPWNIPAYLKKIGNTPTVAALAVDGKNCRGAGLNGLKMAIFWTKFGLEEARRGGYSGDGRIAPLGVDLDMYKPGPQLEARRALGLPSEVLEGFIFGNVNRNQPRKRLDLTIKYFSEWVKETDNRDAFLYLHVCPTGDDAYDISQLMRYYGLSKRLILASPDIGHGAFEEDVVATYQAFSAQITTTQGEGWGLPTMEGMACGIPQVFPDWAALGEWAKLAGLAVPCADTCVTDRKINVIGGVVDGNKFKEALDLIHKSQEKRDELIEAGNTLVNFNAYRWDHIAGLYHQYLEEALY